MLTSRLFLICASIVSFCIETSQATCNVTHVGDTENLLLRGTILTSNGALCDSHVLVESGKITYVGSGHDLGCMLGQKNVTVVDCIGSVISPGFINTHEHIGYSTITPLKDIGERTNQRHDWRVGARNFTRRPAPVNGSEYDATKWGELRHIFSGTTSIVGGEMVPGLARNLDFASGLEDGLFAPTATFDVFPLNDASGIQRLGNCDYGAAAITQDEAGRLYRYLAHVGEGVDAVAENEFQCLSNSTFDVTPLTDGGGLSTDIIAPNLALIHASSLTNEDFDLVAARGAMVVWSPRSNVFLYGKTLNVTYLLDAGITVALGTDWLPSGSATMGREAVCGRDVTQKDYDIGIAPQDIWEMMTINAAKVAGFEHQLGSLDVGKLADIVVFSGDVQQGDAFAQAVYAPSDNLQLVLRGGKILVAGEGLDILATEGCEAVLWGSVTKSICVTDAVNSTFAEFEAVLGGVYPAILPGIPDGEPTCVSTR
ncbi:Metallo-dependent hydrolase [Glarea lozoyensis ATCC 20868]|uniref:Metallo-dependent hydrolase n=1 Tax=Glarea lozoyensis (strain ATCC 20868 / MF5171) TaxID=1116229 RepID=S3DAN9_GLAL2|nr:Metallo-dependent hydrolase [Glarea lozoyensis ATCC 20868]EPE34765.1 Metallo-dependent hydrolase [Glarea lozoyensis ATCC 20868]